jgi:hypothetical protein
MEDNNQNSNSPIDFIATLESTAGSNAMLNWAVEDSNISTITDMIQPTNITTITEEIEPTVISTKFRLQKDTPLLKNTQTNPAWRYFQHFDILYHPDKRHHRCCLVCCQAGQDKAISVGSKASPGPLINHLRCHPEQFQKYLKMKQELDSKPSAVSNQTQLTMSSFTTTTSSTKDNFKKAFIRWIVEQNMPLTVGESPSFVPMIKGINKTVSIPDYKMTHDLLF